MIKEELNQEAEEYFKSICGDYNEEYERTGKRHYWVGYDIKNAYLASAESREKRIAELEQQIEIMKKCENCKNREYSAHEEPCLHCQRCFASKDVKDQENVKDNWELLKEIKEN